MRKLIGLIIILALAAAVAYWLDLGGFRGIVGGRGAQPAGQQQPAGQP